MTDRHMNRVVITRRRRITDACKRELKKPDKRVRLVEVLVLIGSIVAVLLATL